MVLMIENLLMSNKAYHNVINKDDLNTFHVKVHVRKITRKYYNKY